MKRLYFVAFLLLAIGVEAQNRKLVILGSSTSACVGPTDFSNCYVAKLDAYFDAIGRPIDIVQLAVPGYNPYKGMPSSYVPPALPGASVYNYQPDPNNNITKALSLNPDVILVNYPTNAFDSLTIGQVMFAFRTIRDSGLAAGVPVYITTSQPRQSLSFANFAMRQKLKEVRDSVLAEFGSRAINFWDGLADPSTYEILPAYNADDTHLNNAGHDILFQRVRDANAFVSTVLPVKLRSFKATPQKDKVSISWTVADELPGTNYHVQRSSDGVNFQTFQSVSSSNAAATRSYEVADANAGSGILYYRLKVQEGASTFYSQVMKVTVVKNKLSLNSFSVDVPRHQLVINVDAAENTRMELRFMNSAGQLIKLHTQNLQAGSNRISISLSTFPAGLYWAAALVDEQKIFTKGFRVY